MSVQVNKNNYITDNEKSHHCFLTFPKSYSWLRWGINSVYLNKPDGCHAQLVILGHSTNIYTRSISSHCSYFKTILRWISFLSESRMIFLRSSFFREVILSWSRILSEQEWMISKGESSFLIARRCIHMSERLSFRKSRHSSYQNGPILFICAK